MLDCAAVVSRLGNLLLILALLAATGTQWAVLQSVAWTTMLASNLRNGSFTQAVERTFDGKHPCCLCKQIAAGKKAQKKTDLALQLKRLEFLSERPRFIFTAPTYFWHLRPADVFSESVCRPPPTPPPRGISI